MPLQHTNPAAVSAPTGYTHVVSAQGSRIVYLAGQVPIDAQGNVVGEGDLAAQAKQVFENIKACLAAAGAGFNDVVKMTTFVVNYTPVDRPAIVAARAAYLPADKPPASTLVGVQALARPEIRIEIEAVAVLP
jgi:enamine deaminase RidA (YjgF/YER057c/UK114 family)